MGPRALSEVLTDSRYVPRIGLVRVRSVLPSPARTSAATTSCAPTASAGPSASCATLWPPTPSAGRGPRPTPSHPTPIRRPARLCEPASASFIPNRIGVAGRPPRNDRGFRVTWELPLPGVTDPQPDGIVTARRSPDGVYRCATRPARTGLYTCTAAIERIVDGDTLKQLGDMG